MGSPTPILQAFLLADQVYWDRTTGKKVVAGIFFQLKTAKLPALLPQCWAYACLTSVPPEFVCRLRLIRLSDQQVLAESPPIAAVHAAGKLIPHEMMIPIPPIKFEHAGVYEFELLVGDVPLKGWRFSVELVKVQGDSHAADS